MLCERSSTVAMSPIVAVVVGVVLGFGGALTHAAETARATETHAPETVGAAAAFDRTHAAWTALLARHVGWNDAGTATTVDYAGFGRDRAALDAYTDGLAAVAERDFAAWPAADRLAFLVNAYNAHTIALVLTRHPDLASIKDLGGFFASPWKQRVAPLLGATRTLDEIEHRMIRGGVGAAEPRVHFALNCASIGCPALRPEAYRGADLEAQLADQTRRFLSDRTRNRYDPARDRLEVSKIFEWYGDDFAEAAGSVPRWLASFARELADDPEARERIAAARLVFLDYDWRLNDVRTR
jgi:hypothetical protein